MEYQGQMLRFEVLDCYARGIDYNRDPLPPPPQAKGTQLDLIPGRGIIPRARPAD